MNNSLRYEVLSQVNIIKKTLKEAEDLGEVTKKERDNIMIKLSAVKSILFSSNNLESKTYHKQAYINYIS